MLLSLWWLSLLAGLCLANNASFTYNNQTFLLNGTPYQIIGGQMDPQRIPPAYWRQRLAMARAMGLNTIFSYIFWNRFEPRPGQWDFSGQNDVATYFRLAQEEGLHVVLRPGPYICGEHEWGEFPAWLSMIPGMAARQNNGPFSSLRPASISVASPSISRPCRLLAADPSSWSSWRTSTAASGPTTPMSPR